MLRHGLFHSRGSSLSGGTGRTLLCMDSQPPPLAREGRHATAEDAGQRHARKVREPGPCGNASPASIDEDPPRGQGKRVPSHGCRGARRTANQIVPQAVVHGRVLEKGTEDEPERQRTVQARGRRACRVRCADVPGR